MWFKVDDRLAFHEKAVAAGNPAMGLWVRAGSWCGEHLTDGWVPMHMARSIGSVREASALVRTGLWLPQDDGYRFHDWEDFQPSREEVEQRREADAERLRRWRAKRASNGV